MINPFKYLLILLFSALLAGCASNLTQTDPPAQSINAPANLGSITWLNHQADGELLLELAGIYALNKDTAFIFGSFRVPEGDLDSVLLRTGDGGKTWREVMDPVGGSRVQQVAFIDNNQGWALILWTVEGPGEVLLYRTKNGGLTWELLSEVPKRQWYGFPASMTFFDSAKARIDMIYDGGNPETDGVAFLTTQDGGLTWQETGGDSLESYHEQQAGRSDESKGEDGTLWKLSAGDWTAARTTILRRTSAQSHMSTVSLIPKRFIFKGGRPLSQ